MSVGYNLILKTSIALNSKIYSDMYGEPAYLWPWLFLLFWEAAKASSWPAGIAWIIATLNGKFLGKGPSLTCLAQGLIRPVESKP